MPSDVYALILFSVDAFSVLVVGCSAVVVAVVVVVALDAVVVVVAVVFASFFLLNLSRKPICKIGVSNLDINN